jgi:redox-sensitive bicupin YhaK (pirin superfamily)
LPRGRWRTCPLIAGDVGDVKGPGSTYTPMVMLHATVSPGAQLVLPWNVEFNALVYVLAGRGTVGAEQQPIQTAQLAVLGPGNAVTVAAAQAQESRSPQMEVILLGGRPLREAVAWAGPFVMNTEAEVRQAFADFQRADGPDPAVHNAPTDLVVTQTDSALD